MLKRLAMLLVLFALTSSAQAYQGSGNTVRQSIDMSAQGGYVSQSASNSALVMGDNNNVDQSISQTGTGTHVTQSAANAAVVVGNNNQVGQGIDQRATGNTVAQAGANAVAVVGNNNLVDQRIRQQATGNEIFQSGWNVGVVIGDDNRLTQGVLAFAENAPRAVDPTQEMSNSAYIMGYHNQVNQDIAGYVFFGSSNAPVTQTGNNFIQTPDMRYNDYDQRMRFAVQAGPQARVMQSATNEIKIGPW